MEENQAIASVTGDLNGDGVQDTIVLTGRRAEGQLAWQDLSLEITDGTNGTATSIRLAGQAAYDPYLAAGRFTRDCREQVLIVLPTGGSGGIVNFLVYGMREGKIVQLLSGDQFEKAYPYTVQYQNGYAVRLDSLANHAAYLIDLVGKGKEYLGQMYDASGALKTQREGFVSPVGLIYPADVDGDGMLELVLYQQISGLYRADGLGFVISRLAWDGKAFALADQTVGVLPIKQ